VIELEGISRVYHVGGRPVHALHDIDLTIPAGEYVSVMGPSGSGKSTLLNLLGCLDRPTSGAYRLDGRDVARLDELELSRVRRHKIGFVFQSFHLVPRLSAAENVELPMIFAGIERPERESARPSTRSACPRGPATDPTSSRGGSGSASPSPAPS
jgi:putative ABC transport system ATP-binding protein